MKTISRLVSGKMPVGTAAYLGQVEYLMQCDCEVQRGTSYMVFFLQLVYDLYFELFLLGKLKIVIFTSINYDLLNA